MRVGFFYCPSGFFLFIVTSAANGASGVCEGRVGSGNGRRCAAAVAVAVVATHSRPTIAALRGGAKEAGAAGGSQRSLTVHPSAVLYLALGRGRSPDVVEEGRGVLQRVIPVN